MLIEELIGRTITNIYTIYGVEQGRLDTADSFVELDNVLIVGIPFSFSKGVWIRELDPNAQSIFKDLSDYPVYHVNKEGKSIR